MLIGTTSLVTPDGPMDVFLADPDPAVLPNPKPNPDRDAGRRAVGAVIVLQEAFGVTDHIRDVARRVADAGYVAAAPALFHRTGSPVVDYGDVPSVVPHMQALTQHGLLQDLTATVAHLGEQGFDADRIGVVGFCMGGSVAALAAASFDLGAAVSFYGGGVSQGRFGMPPLVELATHLRTPWLGLYGEEDTGIPMSEVQELRAAAATGAVPTAVHTYPGAQHGFHCDDRPAVFDATAAADAWSRTMGWFDEHLLRG